MNPPLEAVLFDLDGTLTDTETDWAQVLDEVAAELGGVLSADVHAAMVGLPMQPSIVLVHAELGVSRDWRLTANELTARLTARYQADVPLRPGAAKLLNSVRQAGLKTALVTATQRSLVETVLRTSSLTDFDIVITGDDVRRAKPDPYPYQLAMRGLDVTADRAVAVEDSPHGVASATASGLPTVVVASDVSVPPGPGRYFVGSLADVDVPLLKSLVGTL